MVDQLVGRELPQQVALPAGASKTLAAKSREDRGDPRDCRVLLTEVDRFEQCVE